MGTQILQRLGYAVTKQTSSSEALALFKVQPDAFDLVITDMTMPGLTGDKLALEMMAVRPDIPVVLCTGYNKKISEEMATAIGIKAMVFKPITTVDLARTVREVLDEAVEDQK
jgi:CheY-like chemotaxis protein